MRTRMIWITFSILFVLASVEAALAFMRDQIASDMQALRQSLAAVEATSAAVNSWIPTVGQMVMGFVLPFALTFVAIPLESFVQSSRHCIGCYISRSLALALLFPSLAGKRQLLLWRVAGEYLRPVHFSAALGGKSDQGQETSN